MKNIKSKVIRFARLFFAAFILCLIVYIIAGVIEIPKLVAVKIAVISLVTAALLYYFTNLKIEDEDIVDDEYITYDIEYLEMLIETNQFESAKAFLAFSKEKKKKE